MPIAPTSKECQPRQDRVRGLELRFSYRHGRCKCYGTGRTRDFTEQILYFDSDQSIPANAQLEVTIECSESMRGMRPLRLLIKGRLSALESGTAMLRIQTFEFQTYGALAFFAPASSGQFVSVLA
jgi:hypothetical protein